MDIISGILTTSYGEEGLKDKTFCSLMRLLGFRNQIRINHWQTCSFAEHKMTDELLGILDSQIDLIGECALGMFEKPQINTVSNNISDIRIASSKFILDEIDKEINQLIEEYKITSFECMISLLGDFSAEIKKFKYLSTLE